jgi:hypothetical protein
MRGARWRSLRHCASKVAGSIPGGADRTMVVESTQPVTEMSNPNKVFLGR